MSDRVKPILRYAGAKWTLAPWIISHMPAHDTYVEPFCGSCAVLFAKTPAAHELVSDRAGDIVTLFRVIRDDPEALSRALALTPYSREEYELSYTITDDLDDVEKARRFMVRVWMSHAGKLGSRAGWRMWRNPKSSASNDMPTLWRNLPDRVWAVVDRLKDVHVEARDFREVLPFYASDPSALIYADPPYVASTLGSDRFYLHDMTDQDHVELLDLLDVHAGPVMLSGYRSDLYDERLTHWRRVDTGTQVYRGAERIESLWLNPSAVQRGRQLPLLHIGIPA
jgi:DNA adenine methylase